MSACQTCLYHQVTCPPVFSISVTVFWGFYFNFLQVSPNYHPVCFVLALPGCPPLQGTEGGQDNFIGVLEKAMKLANQDPDTVGDDDDEEEGPSEAARVRGRTKMCRSCSHASWLVCNQQRYEGCLIVCHSSFEPWLSTNNLNTCWCFLVNWPNFILKEILIIYIFTTFSIFFCSCLPACITATCPKSKISSSSSSRRHPGSETGAQRCVCALTDNQEITSIY